MDPTQILNAYLQQANSPGLTPVILALELLRLAVILGIAYLVARLVRATALRGLRRTNVEAGVISVISRIIFYGTLGIGFMWAFGGFGLSLGLLTLALGFALQDLIKNFAASLVIFSTQPFLEGDTIQVDTFEGRVVESGWRGTQIDTPDGLRVIIPNARIVTTPVVNKSRLPYQRGAIHFQTGSHTDPGQVQAGLLETLAKIKGLSPQPPLQVLLEDLTPEGFSYTVYLWAPRGGRPLGEILSDARLAIQAFLVESQALSPSQGPV